MSTLIENVNDIVLIKEELDALLNEYGVDGGEQFDTYPEKFRELFRLIQDATTIAVDTLYQEVDTVTIVADPVIWQSDNIIQITCATVDAVIYYRMVGLDTGTDWGETEYKNKFYISENAHIEAYAMDKNKQYRSGTVWINAEYILGDVPALPVIDRDHSTGDVTMTCETDGASIFYRNGGSDWTLYEGEVYIPLRDDIYAYSVKNGVASDIVFDAGIDDEERPAIPELSFSDNTITITDSTEGATIYYRERLSDTWILYEGPVTISESGWYVTIAYKDGVYSEQSDPPVFCEYISPIPQVPTISCSNNLVTITCPTPGATIYYKEEDSDVWLIYTSPIPITETVTIESKAFKNGYYSDSTSLECEYSSSGGGDTPGPGYEKPAKPEMSIYYNTVTITCSTPDATIYWMYLLDNEWIEYDGEFEITKTGYYVAKAVKNGIDSDLSDVHYFTWIDTDVIKPHVPEIDYEANTVTITCETSGATIYYKVGEDGNWIEYTGPITITESGVYYTKSEKDSIESDISDGLFCEFYPTPAAPTINCEYNRVYMSSQDGGTILYRKTGDTDWTAYTSSFVISVSAYYEAKVVKNGIYSTTTTALCEYDSEDDYEEYRSSYLTIEIEDIDSITEVHRKIFFQKWNETEGIDKTIEYSKNGGTWTSITSSVRSTYINVSTGDIIQFRGNNDTYYGLRFVGAEKITSSMVPANGKIRFKVYGNIMSLINKDNFVYTDTLTKDYALSNIFHASAVTDARNLVLQAETLSNYCYYGMFNGCTELLYPPVILPATTLSNACYANMFNGCSALTFAPQLPSTNLAPYCYNLMFYTCTSLATPPELPATTLAAYCYKNMFGACTGLLVAPDLLAPTLVRSCYEQMFGGCTSIASIKCLAQSNINSNYSTYRWFLGVSGAPGNTGTFIKKQGVTWPSGASGIPSGWTVEEL